jgi:hypothetical protein
MWRIECGYEKNRPQDQEPLLANDLRDPIEGLDHESASGARAAVLLAMGWAAAL